MSRANMTILALTNVLLLIVIQAANAFEPINDSFRAIEVLHKQLDVDADGEVDDVESKKFLASNKNAAHKWRYLHQDGKDRSISVNELWSAWQGSTVHNWTTDETIYWLVNSVELPEYSQLFEQNSINGTILPRLAADTHFIHKLGITDPSAKKKISIKAMDVVLFGPPKFNNANKLRDIIVTIITMIAFMACFVLYKRNQQSQIALKAMQDHLDSLQREEDQMEELQSELDKALKTQEAVLTEKKNLEHQLEMQRQFSASSNLSDQSRLSTGASKQQSSNLVTNGDLQLPDTESLKKLEDENKRLRQELEETYHFMKANKWRAPYVLRKLLKATYCIESRLYDEKKLNLESRAAEIKLRNQKLQKKKASLFGYYKMAQENSLEEDLNAIVEVKEGIMRITEEIRSRSERWRKIESMCNCTLDLSPKTPGYTDDDDED